MVDLIHLADPALRALAAGSVPDPGLGTQPPGTGGIVTILKWVMWVVAAICVGGLLAVAGRMAVLHQRGEAGQHMTGLAMVLGACVVAGAASSLVAALI